MKSDGGIRGFWNEVNFFPAQPGWFVVVEVDQGDQESIPLAGWLTRKFRAMPENPGCDAYAIDGCMEIVPVITTQGFLEMAIEQEGFIKVRGPREDV